MIRIPTKQKPLARLLVLLALMVGVMAACGNDDDNASASTTVGFQVSSTSTTVVPPAVPADCMLKSSATELVLQTPLVGDALVGANGAQLTSENVVVAPGCSVWGVSTTNKTYVSDNAPLMDGGNNGQVGQVVYKDGPIGTPGEGKQPVTYHLVVVQNGTPLEAAMKSADGADLGNIAELERTGQLRDLVIYSTLYTR